MNAKPEKRICGAGPELRSATERFLKSPLDVDAVHWDHEPVRCNSGTGVSPVCLSHGRDARATIGRFMERGRAARAFGFYYQGDEHTGGTAVPLTTGTIRVCRMEAAHG